MDSVVESEFDWFLISCPSLSNTMTMQAWFGSDAVPFSVGFLALRPIALRYGGMAFPAPEPSFPCWTAHRARYLVLLRLEPPPNSVIAKRDTANIVTGCSRCRIEPLTLVSCRVRQRWPQNFDMGAAFDENRKMAENVLAMPSTSTDRFHPNAKIFGPF
eukprot:2794489-Rhodomonas_salina.3